MVEKILLAVHVVAGILFVGPVAVTTSLFPRFVLAGGQTEGAQPAARSVSVAVLLHRITRTYALLALIVPAVGLVLAGVQDRLGEVWIVVAMSLTAVAGGLLALRIVPLQRDLLQDLATTGNLRSMRMLTGVFNLLWVAVVVLMIVRPGAEA
ncbi:hypothetical protein [Humidisolicoccus flavus]|uniref:hypothetical protein n=1 Tax=Humidisolicoccus flavus TaxID=3111414 RepID=UPI00324DFEFB